MTATASVEVRRSTRSGAVGLAGAAANGALGFVLTTVIVRTLGASGSGALFAVIGVVSIVGAVCCLGADTGLMWALPRRRPGPGGDAARLLATAVLPTVGVAALVAVAGYLAAPTVAGLLFDGGAGDGGAGHGGAGDDGAAVLRLAFAGVPVIVLSTVLLAAVRATRAIGAYVGVQFLLVPMARPLLIGAAVTLGGGVVGGGILGGGVLAAFAGWLLPVAVATVIALVLVVGPLGLLAGATLRPTRADWRTFWAFALPRAASVAIDASSMWVGVLLTAALAGQSEAGVFGAVGRYVLAGLLVMQGLRVAVAPQLSRLLGADRRAEAVEVYRRTTLWIVVLSWPAYLLLAVFAPAFLHLFGAQFRAGATPMAVLAVAMAVNVGVGLVQTVLLMSGNSRRHLVATVVGLALNVAAGVVLIPRHGALGAAVAWSLGIVAENTIAAVYARRALGRPLLAPRSAWAAATVVAATTAASVVGVAVAGRDLPGLAVTLGVLATGGVALLGSRRVRAAVSDVRGRLRPEAIREVPS
ncbi:MAG TPA: oligosaccharide flippase family protein [Actinoplanes sp.]